MLLGVFIFFYLDNIIIYSYSLQELDKFEKYIW